MATLMVLHTARTCDSAVIPASQSVVMWHAPGCSSTAPAVGAHHWSSQSWSASSSSMTRVHLGGVPRLRFASVVICVHIRPSTCCGCTSCNLIKLVLLARPSQVHYVAQGLACSLATPVVISSNLRPGWDSFKIDLGSQPKMGIRKCGKLRQHIIFT